MSGCPPRAHKSRNIHLENRSISDLGVSGTAGTRWFGSGTCGADGRSDAAVAAEVLQVAYAAVGHLPAQDRGSYEGWLQHDGLAQLRATVPAWVAGAGLGSGAFRHRFFDSGSMLVAAHAHGMASQLAGRHRVRLAPRPALRRAGRLRNWCVLLARDASGGSWTQPSGRLRAPVRPALTPALKAARDRQNIRDLAALLETEARGEGRLGMVAVGFTVTNRMQRNGSANVRDEWGAYRHGKRCYSMARLQLSLPCCRPQPRKQLAMWLLRSSPT